MKREQIRQNGKFKGYDYIVFEKPNMDKPETDKPETDKPNTENPQLLNTNSNKDLIKLNTNNSKTEGINYPIELNVEAWESWKDFRKKEYRKSYKDLGEKAAIKKLLKLTQSKEEQALILEQSMENGWIGIFALKSEKKRKINDLMNEYNKGLEILNKQFDD